jgi:hypothetical protein
MNLTENRKGLNGLIIKVEQREKLYNDPARIPNGNRLS